MRPDTEAPWSAASNGSSRFSESDSSAFASAPRARRWAGEYLYIIQSTNLDGLPIYNKAKLIEEDDQEIYYFFSLFKRAI